jgi:hypothetical protein
MPFLVIISRKDNEDVAVLLPQVLYRFSSLLLRIANPYSQWVWIANPDQRHGLNIRRVGYLSRWETARHEHPPGRDQCSVNIRRVGIKV